MSKDPEVAVCIPTYRSAAFIERTLSCAQRQTHNNLKIIVSIDGSFDDTEAICRRIAKSDPRVEVVLQPENRGWTRNTNAALSLAGSEFFFIYFHDDVIEDTYVERLLQALQSRPEAASAHCDLIEFGQFDDVRPAHEYVGSDLHRLVDFMMTKRGTTLRSMMRRSAVGDTVRFPDIHGDNHWAAYVFHMRLLAAGPAVAINQPLYRRWQRDGSLTKSNAWKSPCIEDILKGQRECSEVCNKLFAETLSDSQDQWVAAKALVMFQRQFVRQMQLQIDNHTPLSEHLYWEPGWFNNVPIADETRELLEAGERSLAALEERFA